MFKKIIVACICLGVLLGIFFFFRKTESKKDVLVVGMMSGWAPFMSINGEGDFEGFDVDVAHEVANRMGKKVVIEDLGSLSSCFIALEQNKVDMILSGLNITQERLNKLNMVPYVGEGTKEYLLVFWKDIPTGISQIQDLKAIKSAIVCIEPGNSTEKYLDQFEYITKRPLSSLADMILDIQYGKSLALFLEPQVVTRLTQTCPEIKYISVPLPPEFQVFGCGIALKKENTSLNDTVASVIQELKQEGILKRLETKWQMTGV